MKEGINLFTFHLFTQSATLTAAVKDAGVALRLYEIMFHLVLWPWTCFLLCKTKAF